jgi:hypothetical protein
MINNTVFLSGEPMDTEPSPIHDVEPMPVQDTKPVPVQDTEPLAA